MKNRNIGYYILFILIPVSVGGIGGFFTQLSMDRFNALEKPFFQPPEIVFPIVWTVLYVLMGIGMARVWLSGSPIRRDAFNFYALQITANFIWTLLFFVMEMRLSAFLWLLLLIILVGIMTRLFWRADSLAGKLQLPYLAWSVFAAVLNLAVWYLNR
ncbi:MAG: tryptophan-rich sensory protein [Clostridia bacterium]|nr:tryptophan-rich sensory protein [Clostridia bacterium]